MATDKDKDKKQPQETLTEKLARIMAEIQAAPIKKGGGK